MKRLSLLQMVCVVLLFCAVTAIASPAQILATLYNFCSRPNCTDGADPFAGLVQATDGNFYGTTAGGGDPNSSGGTVFKITPSGMLTTLHSFEGYPADGQFPYGGLIQATDGNFYGTTSGGGPYNDAGTVFKIIPSGALTTLHNFCLGGFPCPDGEYSEAKLIQATDGNFYGTTYEGGAHSNCDFRRFACGTVFKITPSEELTTLHSFNGSDGSNPAVGLVQSTDGNFYGTTARGGSYCPPYGCGTVFKITPSGMLTTLYNFCSQTGCADGSTPWAGLVQGTDGNFYGTTQNGGASYSAGTVFRITPSGTLTTLYSFCPQPSCADGANPDAGLIQATDGAFYGTTHGGGTDFDGTVFKVTATGTLTTLYSFNSIVGASPEAGLIQATDGNLYGTTSQGGANGDGTVFRLNPLVSLSPTNLNFGAQGIDMPNTPQTVTLTNSGAAPLLITNIGITGSDSGDFSLQGNTCPIDPETLTPGGYCAITLVFSPTASGMRTADVTITDNAPDDPQIVPLTGVGVGGKVRPK